MLGPMSVAVRKIHWGKRIWVSEGGAELPVVNMAVAIALALSEPGRFSLDRALGLKLPSAVTPLLTAAVALGVAYSEVATPAPGADQVAGAELQASQGGAEAEPL